MEWWFPGNREWLLWVLVDMQLCGVQPNLGRNFCTCISHVEFGDGECVVSSVFVNVVCVTRHTFLHFGRCCPNVLVLAPGGGILIDTTLLTM